MRIRNNKNDIYVTTKHMNKNHNTHKTLQYIHKHSSNENKYTTLLEMDVNKARKIQVIENKIKNQLKNEIKPNLN